MKLTKMGGRDKSYVINVFTEQKPSSGLIMISIIKFPSLITNPITIVF